MKTPKPRLFTREFVDLCVLVLALVIGGITLVVYKDGLPLWMILAIGFWYPLWRLVHWMFHSNKGDDL